jgi:hypothetical protein
MISDWVVRGGVAQWQDLIAAYRPDPNVQGIYGFSVQYASGVPWEDLARAASFPHSKVCYADRSNLEKVIAQLGYMLVLVATPGKGYHHELCLTLMQNGVMLQTLPVVAAKALSAVFQQHIEPRPI